MKTPRTYSVSEAALGVAVWCAMLAISLSVIALFWVVVFWLIPHLMFGWG